MAPIGTLWGVGRLPSTKIILSVAALNDLELEQPEWDFSDKPAAYASKFTYGKIPAFEGVDGFRLIEGATIARYLSGLGNKVNLLGTDVKEIALVDQWTHFAEQEIGAPSSQIIGAAHGFSGSANSEVLDQQTKRLARALNYVESYLETRPSGYLVSDSVTLADLFLVGMIYGASYAALGAAERAQYPRIFAHFAKVTADDKVKRFWGTERFAEVKFTERKSSSLS